MFVIYKCHLCWQGLHTIQECQFCLAYHTKLFRHRFLKKWPKYLEMCLGDCKNDKNKYQWNLYCQLTKPLLFTVDFLKEKKKEKKAHINAHRFSLFTPVCFLPLVGDTIGKIFFLSLTPPIVTSPSPGWHTSLYSHDITGCCWRQATPSLCTFPPSISMSPTQTQMHKQT